MRFDPLTPSRNRNIVQRAPGEEKKDRPVLVGGGRFFGGAVVVGGGGWVCVGVVGVWGGWWD